MAFTFLLNQVHTPQQALYELLQQLKAAGWTVMSSGDGTGGSYSPAGDVFTTWSTTTEAVVGAITNRLAWYRIQAPNGRELVYKHSNFNVATDLCSFHYSRSAGFVGSGDGAPSATIAPTATDAWFVGADRRHNAGGTSFSNATAITRVDYMIGDAAEGYAFACFLRSATGAIRGGIMFDVLMNPDPADVDPAVLWHLGLTSAPFQALQDQRTFWLWGDAGSGGSPTISLSGQGRGKYPGADWAPEGRADVAQEVGIGNPCYWQRQYVFYPSAANPYDSNVDIMEPCYWYTIAQGGQFSSPPFGNPMCRGLIWGESRFIKGRSSNAGFSNMDTNVALTRIGQLSEGVWLLWDGVTVPLL